ncbi:MAG TPA: hypothetical protein VGC07_07895 [Granulicella sp.]
MAVLLFAGCNSSSTPAANTSTSTAESAPKPAATAEPVAGETALWPMYTAAHGMAPDVAILRLTSKEVPGFTQQDGKAAAWVATFASPSTRIFRVDTYSIVSKPPDFYRGTSAGVKQPWRGESRDEMPLDTSTLSVDSDAAYKTAVADPDTAAWLKKNPDKKLTLIELGNVFRYHAPVWYLTWGDAKSGGYAVYVNATTGKVIKG